MRTLILLLALAANAAFAEVLAEPPSQDYINNCIGIGTSSGCTGCNLSPSCQWCLDRYRPFNGQCRPNGDCASKTGTLDISYAVGDHFCPLDTGLAGEKPLQGRFDSMDMWSSSHRGHFCEFPKNPWTVDRMARFNGHATYTECFKVNKELKHLPSRQELDICLAKEDRLNLLQTTRLQQAKTLTAARAQCVKNFQTMSCTFGCPAYNSTFNNAKLCPDYVNALFGQCDRAIKACIPGIQAALDMAKNVKPDEVCYSPNSGNLAPSKWSGQFEAAMCLSPTTIGQLTSCHAGPVDCQIGNYGAYICSKEWVRGDLMTQCCKDVTLDAAANPPTASLKTQLGFEIVHPGFGSGKTCLKAFEEKYPLEALHAINTQRSAMIQGPLTNLPPKYLTRRVIGPQGPSGPATYVVADMEYYLPYAGFSPMANIQDGCATCVWGFVGYCDQNGDASYLQTDPLKITCQDRCNIP